MSDGKIDLLKNVEHYMLLYIKLRSIYFKKDVLGQLYKDYAHLCHILNLIMGYTQKPNIVVAVYVRSGATCSKLGISIT